MYGMTQIKILEFIDSIKNKDELQLTSANCGIFAILLKRIFDVGEFVAIVGDLEQEMVYHIMLKIDDKYYDSQGEWTKEEIIRMYEKINRSKMAIESRIDEDHIEKLTKPNMMAFELIAKLKF